MSSPPPTPAARRTCQDGSAFIRRVVKISLTRRVRPLPSACPTSATRLHPAGYTRNEDADEGVYRLPGDCEPFPAIERGRKSEEAGASPGIPRENSTIRRTLLHPSLNPASNYSDEKWDRLIRNSPGIPRGGRSPRTRASCPSLVRHQRSARLYLFGAN